MTTIAPFIKDIGRGAQGARALDEAQATTLMARVLDREVSDFEIGAFALAMRMKGETVQELLGFLSATAARCLPIASTVPVIVIPSYNGARRLPNLTPLLAMRLAQEGARVLVHGPRKDAGRVTTAEVFEALGLMPANTEDKVRERWQMHEPAFLPTDALSPKLQALLDVRWQVGVRNSGHTVAKLLSVVHGAPVLQLASHTHPEFGKLMAEVAAQAGLNLMLLRGTEGEPVADARRQPRMSFWLDGQAREDLTLPAQEGSLRNLPLLPACDAAATAVYIQAVLAGAKPLPEPIEQQVAQLLRALAELTDRASQSLRA